MSQPTHVIHCVFQGDQAFLARSLETGEEAIVITQNRKLKGGGGVSVFPTMQA